MSADTTPITRDQLVAAIAAKAGTLTISALHYTDEQVGNLIRLHGLEHVIAGRSEGKPVTFARAFEVVFGRRL